jgi:hypothetical protein
MKITIATLANKRPDFIELQYRSIAQYVKDEQIEYVVFNNAFDDRQRFDAIEDICRTLGVRSVAVNGKDFGNVCETVAYSLNKIWKRELSSVSGILTIIDSDMFFIKDIRIESLMHGYDFGFVPSYRGSSFEVQYPWTGLMFFNMDTLPEVSTFRWDVGRILGHRVDVGGLNHHYLKKHADALRILYLEMLTLESLDTHTDGTKDLICGLNGNARFIAHLNQSGQIVTMTTDDPQVSANRSFPHHKERPDHREHIVTESLRFEKLLTEYGFPHPFWVDLFKPHGMDFDQAFIFHYKSGSNWIPFYTKEYNAAKTAALVQFLGIDPAALSVKEAVYYDSEKTRTSAITKAFLKGRQRTYRLLSKMGLLR